MNKRSGESSSQNLLGESTSLVLNAAASAAGRGVHNTPNNNPPNLITAVAGFVLGFFRRRVVHHNPAICAPWGVSRTFQKSYREAPEELKGSYREAKGKLSASRARVSRGFGAHRSTSTGGHTHG